MGHFEDRVNSVDVCIQKCSKYPFCRCLQYGRIDRTGRGAKYNHIKIRRRRTIGRAWQSILGKIIGLVVWKVFECFTDTSNLYQMSTANTRPREGYPQTASEIYLIIECGPERLGDHLVIRTFAIFKGWCGGL